VVVGLGVRRRAQRAGRLAVEGPGAEG